MKKRKNPSSVDIQKVLLDMREYRMGLIQTPDQLRFSYMAVIEGAKLILTDNSVPQVAQSHSFIVKPFSSPVGSGLDFALTCMSRHAAHSWRKSG